MFIGTALRSLRRSPGFAAVVVLSLAAGLGANTALFSLLNAVGIRPLPYRDAGRLVDVAEDNPAELCAGCSVGTSYSTYRDWRNGASSFERLDAYQELPVTMAGSTGPERVAGALVTAGLFETLGVEPLVGRQFIDADDAPGAAGVVMLSHRLWTNQFGADRSVVGRSLRLNGESFVVVGVMPPRFGFPEFAKLWIPIGSRRLDQPRDDRSLGVVGRLKPGVTRAAAGAEMAVLAAATGRAEPATNAGWTAMVSPLERPLADAGVNTGFAIALAISGLVLLIACANLANILLARGANRARETAIRLALGAGRGTVIRHYLTESLVLALGGGLVGMVIAAWVVRGLVAVIGTEIPSWIDLSFDGSVFGFGAIVAVAAGLLFGLMPAIRAGRIDVQQALKTGSSATAGGRGQTRLRDSLVVVQVTLAVALLAGAGILVASFTKWQRYDPGFDARSVLTGSVALDGSRYEAPEPVGAFASRLIERVAGLPGVDAASIEHQEFLGAFVGTASRVTIEGAGQPVPHAAGPRFAFAVTPKYFDIRGLRPLEGRLLSDADGPSAPLVAVVSRTAADRLWPGQPALGRRFRIGDSTDARWYAVVGVVAGVPKGPLGDREPTPLIYTAFGQNPSRPITVLVRTPAEAAAFGPALRSAVQELDPDQPVDGLMTLARFQATTIAPLRFMMLIVGTLGAFALLLVTLGLYGVLAYLVAQRTRELGIRMALGAASTAVVALVLRRGMGLVMIGIGLGLPLAVAVSKLLGSALFGLVAADPVVYVVVALGLGLIAILACLGPARRASRVEPMVALRSE